MPWLILCSAGRSHSKAGDMSNLSRLLKDASKDEVLRSQLQNQRNSVGALYELTPDEIVSLDRIASDTYGMSPGGLLALSKVLLGYSEMNS